MTNAPIVSQLQSSATAVGDNAVRLHTLLLKLCRFLERMRLMLSISSGRRGRLWGRGSTLNRIVRIYRVLYWWFGTSRKFIRYAIAIALIILKLVKHIDYINFFFWLFSPSNKKCRLCLIKLLALKNGAGIEVSAFES